MTGDATRILEPGEPPARTIWIVALSIAALTLGLYASVAGHDFVTYDDGKYVTDNPVVRAGLTAEGVRWAFTTTQASNWHPLTWLSHMLDVELFGLDAGRQHLFNALLHALNAALLFVALVRLRTGAGVAAIVALLFAVHPLRVESVAWIAERKDVLSGLFWMLGLLAWARYVRAPGPRRYALVVACLVAGLLAKPMLVSFPFVLLCLDLWPLGRLSRASARRLVVEKLPLVAVAAASAAVTVFAQERGGAISDLEALPLATRVPHAFVATALYLGKLAWPAHLAVFYPHPALVDPDYASLGPGAWLAIAFVLAVTVAAVRLAGRAPWLAAGWGWTLVTLLPVIGLVQVGTQAMADRYAYLPLIGVTLSVVAGAAELARRHPAWRAGLVGLAALAIVAAAVRTRDQIATWRDSVTLFEHALRTTEKNAVAHVHLGGHFAAAGQLAEARRHYEAALEILPNEVHALTNLGTIASRAGEHVEARRLLERALSIAPGFAPASNALGALLERTGDAAGARRRYEQAVAADPWSFEARANLGGLLLRTGQLDLALPHLERALALRPGDAATHVELGVLWRSRGDLARAAALFETAMRLDPRDAHAPYDLGVVRERQGDTAQALALYERASQSDPRLPEPHVRRGALLEAEGHLDAALDAYRAALALEPPPPFAAERLAWRLVTHPELADDAGEALRWARFLAESTDHASVPDLDLLAAAHAAAGERDEAVRWQARALELTPEAEEAARTERRRRLELFGNGGRLEGTPAPREATDATGATDGPR